MNALLKPETPEGLRRRAMCAADADAVMAIEARAYSHPWSRGNFIDSIAAGYTCELLENQAGELLGYFVAMPGVDELHLLNITVRPEDQGCGLGRLLLAAVEDHARDLQVEKLWLEVRISNERARQLYARHGYAEVGRRRAYYPALQGREDAVLMALTLRSAEGER